MKKKIGDDEYNDLRNQINYNKDFNEKFIPYSIKNINNNSIKNQDNTTTKYKYKKNSFLSNSNQIINLKFRLPRSIRWFIFCIFVLVTIMINMDHGTIPAATEEIKRSLDLGNDVLGYFGSLVFFGNIIGALLSLSVINWINRKYLLLVSLILNGLLLFSFTITTIKWILFINRILVGICQSFISIYLPVWCDQFGIKKRRPIMISIIQSGSPLGVVFGYLLTAYVKNIDSLNWKSSFIIQAIFSGILGLIILFIPKIYFSSTLNSEQISLSQEEKSLISNEFKPQKSTKSLLSNNASIKEDLSVYHDNSILNGQKSIGFFSDFCQIIKKKVFIFSALALSNLFFIITAIQFWGSDYEKLVLGEKNNSKILFSFAIVCITSPTLGLFFGGLISSLTGGYEAKHSIVVCLIFGLFAGVAAIPVPMTDDIMYFTLYLWLVLFFGAAILPNLIGIIITSLPHHLRGSANSITNLITNLFGYLPAPAIYGFIYENSKESNNRLAMQIIIYSSFVGSVLLVFAMYFRYKINKDEETLKERKTSVISTNSLTDNLAKFYNPHSALNINNYENTLEIVEESSSSENSYDSDEFNKPIIENNHTIRKNNNSKINKDFYAESVSTSANNDFTKYSNGKNLIKYNKNLPENNNVNVQNFNDPIKGKKNFNGTNSTNSKNYIQSSIPSKNSFDIAITEENTEYSTQMQLNFLKSKKGTVSNYYKGENKNYNPNVGQYKDSEIKANPNFNYNKYLEENIFNGDIENDKELISKGEGNKDLYETNNINGKNNYGKNKLNNTNNNTIINMYPLSIKTPNFNFVGNSHENFFLEEREKINSYSNNGNKNPNLVYFSNSDNKQTEVNLKPSYDKNPQVNPCEKYEDLKIKFSYESANNRSEYSLFNPIKNQLNILNKFSDSNNKDEQVNNKLDENNKNISLKQKIIQLYTDSNLKENEKLSNKETEEKEILLSEQSVDVENNKFKEDLTNSYKNYDELI